MPPTMRSAAKATKEAPKQADVKQELTPPSISKSAGDNKQAHVSRREVPKTPSRKAIKTPATTSSKKRKQFSSTSWPWTHERPTAEAAAEQVRIYGRNLIPWQRPRMAEKLLLNLEFECTRQGIAVPWDDIAHRFHPGATAAGVQQHLARLRSIMVAEGHLIPPKLPNKKDRGPVDSTIRGYLRKDLDQDGSILVRPVKYTEPLEHPTFNRADAHDLGAYGDVDKHDEAEDIAQVFSRKARKRDASEKGEPSSASKSTGPRRRSRIAIKYEDVTESDSEEEDTDEEDEIDLHNKYKVRPDNDDDEEEEVPLDERPIRGDVDVEDLAFQLYTQNMNPRLFSNDPTPIYFVQGEPLSFKQVCAKAVRLYQHYGYQDPECGRIIAEHSRRGFPPPLAHFQYGNDEHPVTQYPHLHLPLGSLPVAGANTMSPIRDNRSLGFNADNMGYVTPVTNQHPKFSLFNAYDRASGSGSRRGFKVDSSSPTDFNPGGGMTSPPSPTDYKSTDKHQSFVDWGKNENDDVPVDPFINYKLSHNVLDSAGTIISPGAIMSPGADSNQAFNTATYSQHMTASHMNRHAGHNSGCSMGTDKVDGWADLPFGRDFLDHNVDNVGFVNGPSSSATTKVMLNPQDIPTPDHPSTFKLPLSPDAAQDGHNEHDFDEQFDEFTLPEDSDDDIDTDKSASLSEQ